MEESDSKSAGIEQTEVILRPVKASHLRWCALAVAILALVVRVPWLPMLGFKTDQLLFMVWSDLARSDSALSPSGGGFDVVYSLGTGVPGQRLCNYPPLFLYVLRALPATYEAIAPAEEPFNRELLIDVEMSKNTPAVRRAAAVYKLPGVVSEVLLATLLVFFLSRRLPLITATTVAALYAISPAIVQNSAIWGQVDGILTLLLVISLEMLIRNRILLAALFALLAFLFKAQALMLAPIWLVAGSLWAGADLKKWLQLAAVLTGTALVVLVPFAGALHGVWSAYSTANTFFPMTHVNGFSFWFVVHPLLSPHLAAKNVAEWYVSDRVPIFLGITPLAYGTIAVLTVWVYVLLRTLVNRAKVDIVFWAARLLPLAFFILPTQMHERYLVPAIGIWAWACVPGKRWWLCWFAISICAAINVFWAMPGPNAAAWASDVAVVLHREWLGLAPGVWCGVCLIAVFLVSLRGPRAGNESFSLRPPV